MDKNKIIEGAAKLVAKGAYDKAIKEYQKVLDADPKDVRVLQKMGELYVKKNDNAQAANFFTKVAESYASDGFFLKAVALYKQVQKLDPELFEVNVKLGELHQQLGLMSEATAYFQLVANHYDKQGNAKASLDTLKKMVDLDPDNTSSRRKLAELYAREGMNREAAGEFKRVAEYFQKNNRQDDYLAVAERIAQLEPDNISLARELAKTYLAKSDQKRALAKLQICFKADPRDIETLQLLADAFNGLGQTSKTVSVYKELAKIHQELGKARESDSFWERIGTLDPDDADFAARRAPQGAPEPVRATAPAATASRPTAEREQPPPPPPSRTEPLRKDQLAKLLTETDVYMKYGLHDKALEHLRRVFAVEPENLDAHEKAYHIYLGAKQKAQASEQLLNVLRLCTRQSEVDRAQPYLDTLLKEHPTHPEMPAFLAVLRPEGGDIVTGEDEEAILVDSTEEEIVVSEAPEDALAETAEAASAVIEETPAELMDDGEEIVADSADEVIDEGVELGDLGDGDEPFNPESTVQVDAAYAREAYHTRGKGAANAQADDEEMSVEAADFDDPIEDEMEVTNADADALALAADGMEGTDGDADALSLAAEDHEEVVTSDELGDPHPDATADDFTDRTEPEIEVESTEVKSYDLGEEEPANFDSEPLLDEDSAPVVTGFEEPSVTSTDPMADSFEGSRQDEVAPFEPEPELEPEVEHDAFASAEEEPVEAPVEDDSDDPVAAECEEAAFFMAQGLHDEAREILETVMIASPGNPRAQELLDQLETLVASGAASHESVSADHRPMAEDAPPTVSLVSEGDEGKDAFDLAAELAEDFEEVEAEAEPVSSAGGDDFQYSVEEVFTEFKKGLAKVVKPEDVETHYDLGIAYKEMGLMDDAIGEFQVAREGCMGKKKEVDCLSMSAQLQGMKGDWAAAVTSLKAALNTEFAQGEVEKALTFELGQARESEGETGKALFHFQRVAQMDGTYRNVSDKVAELSGSASPEEDPIALPRRAARKVGYL